MSSFNCDRTCPIFGERWCRFRPVLDILGPTRADSHTVRVAIELRDAQALRAAVEALGGQWLGQGEHRLYQGPEVGLGFRLPGWAYPLVLRSDGRLAFDHFGGQWGNVADLDRLRAEYVLRLAERRAQDLGWLLERNGDVLTIYHPSGGTLTVTADGTVDAVGFVGQGCHQAILSLDLGRWLEAQVKPEYAAQPATVREVEP